MGFNDNFPQISTKIISQLGESVTYTQSGSPNYIKVVFSGRSKDIGDPDAHSLASEAYLSESDITQPAYGDTILRSGNTWHVVQIVENLLGVWRLIVHDKLTSDFRRSRRLT